MPCAMWCVCLSTDGAAYHRVSEQVWDYLLQSYGGGPVVVMGTSRLV